MKQVVFSILFSLNNKNEANEVNTSLSGKYILSSDNEFYGTLQLDI